MNYIIFDLEWNSFRDVKNNINYYKNLMRRQGFWMK
ncbi:Uncharacterised protein [Clostridium sporogenes]|nr:Uncharacterised protein [Clostridium sporogenes]